MANVASRTSKFPLELGAAGAALQEKPKNTQTKNMITTIKALLQMRKRCPSLHKRCRCRTPRSNLNENLSSPQRALSKYRSSLHMLSGLLYSVNSVDIPRRVIRNISEQPMKGYADAPVTPGKTRMSPSVARAPISTYKTLNKRMSLWNTIPTRPRDP